MRKLLRALKWIATHIYFRKKDLNEGEGKPVQATEIGFKIEF